MVGGYNDDEMSSVEFFEDGAWIIGQQDLEFGR